MARGAWGSRTAFVPPKAGVPTPRGGSSTSVCPSGVRHAQLSPRQPGTSPPQRIGDVSSRAQRREPPRFQLHQPRGCKAAARARRRGLFQFTFVVFHFKMKLSYREEGGKKNTRTKKQTHNLFFKAMHQRIPSGKNTLTWRFSCTLAVLGVSVLLHFQNACPWPIPSVLCFFFGCFLFFW